jgi:biotin carboxyl carrier protein
MTVAGYYFQRKTKKKSMSGKNETFEVKVNDFIFSVTQEDMESSNIISKSPTEFHLIKDHRSVTGKVHESDTARKRLRVEVGGDTFDIEIKEPLDQMLEKMGFGSVSSRHIKDIKAPMPGLVLKISVSEGQDGKEGDSVLILEAMKMENNIVLHKDSKIKKILVKSGQAVEKGQVLVELE